MIAEVARELGLPYNTVWHWCRDRQETVVTGTAARCFRCRASAPEDPAAYGYLLGLYLGDGHLVTSARVPVLRIYCDRSWPGLIDACDATMRAVLAGSAQRIRQKQGCVSVQSYGRHWPCLLPQHGPGKKHDRPIVLTDWQRAIVAADPAPLIRGLFHSDGCRLTNQVHRHGRLYRYPRYMFTNRSTDIMEICRWGLDLLGVDWRMNRADSLSVARRTSVATLDRHVGPKS
jgi:hypothetical protein